jgi:hypothetical protein
MPSSTVRERVLLGVGAAVGAVLAVGANGPLYRVLYQYVPGFDGSRTPGRLILWPTLQMARAGGPCWVQLQDAAGEQAFLTSHVRPRVAPHLGYVRASCRAVGVPMGSLPPVICNSACRIDGVR